MNRILIFFGAVALGLVGCGTPSATDICEDISEDCSKAISYDECAAEGESLTELAEERGCEDAMDMYLDCLDSDVCAWEITCGAEWEEVNRCVGQSP